MAFITAKDAVDRLTSYLGQNVGDAATFDCYRAIADALRDLGMCHRWAYLISEQLIATNEPQDDGTITYTASTRRVTLASSTWPSWTKYGVIVLPTAQHCRIYRVVSSTIIELESNSAPGENIAAGSSYTLYRDMYALPADFHQGNTAVRSGTSQCLDWMAPAQWAEAGSGFVPVGGRPLRCTFMGLPENYGSIALVVAPYPTTAETLRMVYKRLPRKITTWEYTDGTTTATAATSTITGNSTAWTSAMVGSVIRLTSSTTDVPDEFQYPALEEFRILAVDSATSLTIDGTLANNYVTSKYVISDPIDIDYATMQNAFWYGCYKFLANHRVVKDKPNAAALYEREVKAAKAADSRTLQRYQVGSNYGVNWYQP